jgi:pimeloyl-ACP methyl ester carboxylesterase
MHGRETKDLPVPMRFPQIPAPARAATRTTSPAQPPHTAAPRSRLALHAVLLVALLAVFAFSSFQVVAYERGVTRESFLLQGAIPVPVLRFTPDGQRLNVVAVLAHGYSATKELMSSLAVDLAKQGITAYTFDFPGHGASPVTYGGVDGLGPVAGLVASLGEVVDYAVAHGPAPNIHVVLVGYSLGTIAVGEYALRHPAQANIAATVLVAGILGDRPTTTVPRSLLVLSGQFDLPGINETARAVTAAGCGVAARLVTDTYQCGASPTTERRRLVLPGLDHISIVTAGSTHAAVIGWLHTTVDAHIGAVLVNSDARLHWMLLAFLAAALATLPLLALGAAALRVAPTREDTGRAKVAEAPARPAPPGWLALLAYAGSLAGALVPLRLYLPESFWAPEPFPFGFIHQQVSGDTAVFLLLAGVLLTGTLVLVPTLRQTVVWPARTGWRQQGLLAFGTTLFLYLTIGTLSSFAWESLTLTPERLWRAGVYVLLVLPFFIGLRALLGGVAKGRPWRAGLIELSFTLLILVAFVVAIAMNFGRLSYLGILLPVVGIALLASAGIAVWTRRVVVRPTLVLAIGQALLLGWLLAAPLPLITYH